MKIIDKYIIKQYLTTFFVMFGLFIPIGIMVDFAEKIDKFRENEVPADFQNTTQNQCNNLILSQQEPHFL